MLPVAYCYVDTDGEVMHGKLYYDMHYHCLVRNKIVRLRDACGAFGVYLNKLYTDTFCVL